MVFVILLWTGTGIALTLAFNQENEEAVAQTFGAINCAQMEGSFLAKGTLKEDYLTGKEQEQLLRDLAEEIGITSECEILEERKNNTRSITLNKQSMAALVEMKIMTHEVEVEDDVIQTQQYFSMSLSLKEYVTEIVLLKEEIENVLEQYPFECDYSMEFQADFSGELSMAEKNKLSRWYLDEINADIINSNKTPELYTIYAYTDYIRDYELVDSKAVNVNLVFSYDEEENYTHFYMATPYMLEEY